IRYGSVQGAFSWLEHGRQRASPGSEYRPGSMRRTPRFTKAGYMQRLDDTDAEIVRALQEDGRMPYGELAERTGLSETQARRRVRALIDADIISLTTIADPRVFGLDWMAWVALSARQADAADIAEQLIRIPAINYVILAAGHA